MRRVLTIIIMIIVIAAVGTVAGLIIYRGHVRRAEERAQKEKEIAAEERELNEAKKSVREAEKLAAMYDYDGAIGLLQSQKNYEMNTTIVNAIAKYTIAKTSLEAKDVTTVPHLYFHSLIVDPKRAFNTAQWGTQAVNSTNAWMTTADEFDKILNQLYKNGYVLVRMRDLVKTVKNKDGTTSFAANDKLLLPADKKPIVLSIDDWNDYHSYAGKGYAGKAVLNKKGEVKVRYTDSSGKTTTGDDDVVPKIDTFIAKHPDFSYKGARGMIALTGYNGVMGYRTDPVYKTREGLSKTQVSWLNDHPDFDYDKEVAGAKKIAKALKAEGWEFASHTWGHISVSSKSVDELKADNEQWVKSVQPIVGKVDTLMFTHGCDIGDWRSYDASTNAKYAYYKSAGYKFFSNVDASNTAWIQIRKDYVRQGRIDCDGLQMYRAMTGKSKTNVFAKLFNVKEVFSKARPTPVTTGN